MDELQEKLAKCANPDLLKFEDILMEMKQLYIKKNSDYGNSFAESCDKFGLISPIVRMFDKLNRLESLSKCNSSRKVEDEKIEDTLLDLANYAVMALIWMKNHEN